MAKLPLFPQVVKISWTIFDNFLFKTRFFLNLSSLSESVGRLYDNYEGLLDQFAAFWGEVARTFAGSKIYYF